MAHIVRRSLLGGFAAATLLGARPLRAAASTMVISKDPNCGCCSGWVERVRAAGFDVRVHDKNDLAPVKARLGIPPALASCHTAEIDGYVIERHVPALAIKRLLSERPAAIGLAVPACPSALPAWKCLAPDETYDVLLFGPSLRSVFARFKGAHEIR